MALATIGANNKTYSLEATHMTLDILQRLIENADIKQLGLNLDNLIFRGELDEVQADNNVSGYLNIRYGVEFSTKEIDDEVGLGRQYTVFRVSDTTYGDSIAVPRFVAYDLPWCDVIEGVTNEGLACKGTAGATFSCFVKAMLEQLQGDSLHTNKTVHLEIAVSGKSERGMAHLEWALEKAEQVVKALYHGCNVAVKFLDIESAESTDEVLARVHQLYAETHDEPETTVESETAVEPETTVKASTSLQTQLVKIQRVRGRARRVQRAIAKARLELLLLE